MGVQLWKQLERHLHAQVELAKDMISVELQRMVGWLATQYQRVAAKAEADNQFSAAVQ